LKYLINSYNIPAILFFIIIIIFFSCKKNENSTIHSDPDIKKESELSGKGTLVFGENREKQSDAKVDDNIQNSYSEIEKSDIKGQLFSVSSVDIFPEDMEIGILLNYNSVKLVSGSFLFAITTFLNDVKNGIINKDVLHPSWAGSIQKLYHNRLSDSDFSFRIGSIVNKKGTKSANIRLISDQGRVSGSVIADNYEGNWLLSNISVNFNQLENTYLKENIEFKPLSYSNILLNY
jgi:hypothetical protein